MRHAQRAARPRILTPDAVDARATAGTRKR
jgi:hypothetical protein